MELPPKKLLEAKLNEAIRLARGEIKAREEMARDEEEPERPSRAKLETYP
jgi:hypothetical protein